ncbi:energy transducer TonB [Methylonatrum kenyense]|uniref:energy transducer TonB n=1 Tax=Methylonatrum kenyense TaxID=455253 RepID=UPI0020BF86E3|nr:energy transducer TonB [Methylonatrum kenyense]MCK8516636.1 energy transducer TonB [Methylonatrum kenyense]
MQQATVTSNDRLSMTLFLAAVIHVLVILGLGFSGVLPTPRFPPLMEITLSQTPTESAPDDYDFLAQHDQVGGGSSEQATAPQAPAAAASATPRQSARQEQTSEQQLEDTPLVGLDTERAATEEPETPEKQEMEHSHSPVAQPGIDSQVVDIHQRLDWDARYPSAQRIDARTRSHHAAAYMQDWVDTVEDVGNRHYPSEARRLGLTGSLVLEVMLRPDGTVARARVLRPSPYPLLDEAALQLVQLAAPYAPVSDDVLDGNNRLVITRTWEFVGGNQLQAQ